MLKLSDSLKYTHNTRALDPSSSISIVKHERTFATAKGMWRSSAVGLQWEKPNILACTASAEWESSVIVVSVNW